MFKFGETKLNLPIHAYRFKPAAFAEKISRNNRYVIATNDLLPDSGGVAFAQGFYHAFANGKGIEASFYAGIAQIPNGGALYSLWHSGSKQTIEL